MVIHDRRMAAVADVVRRICELEPGGRLAAPLIAGLDVVTRSAGEGEVEYVARIKRVDPLKALELLGRHLGIFERDNRQSAPVIVIPGGLEET